MSESSSSSSSSSKDESPSLVNRVASRYGIDPVKFFDSLKATAFKQRDGSAPTNEQMMALLIVAEQYRLNPFTKEIYAYPDRENGIIPVIGVDGWSRIINEHPQYDGVEFVYSNKLVQMRGAKVESPDWIECVMYRKDRTRPIRIKEFLDEVYRPPFQLKSKGGNQYTMDGPWQTHTKRQLRHKALIQCARIAFGFSGIYDIDEDERIHEQSEKIINPVNFEDGDREGCLEDKTHTPLTIEQNEVQAPLTDIEHKQLDEVVRLLVKRVGDINNSWKPAFQYAKRRYQNDQRSLCYIVDALKAKELKAKEQTQQPQQPQANMAIDLHEATKFCDGDHYY